MSRVHHFRHVDDIRTALSATLKQDDEDGVSQVVDLTGLTVKFKMVDFYGNTVVAETETGVLVDSAIDGEVSYDFSAADVDVSGDYYGYFIVDSSGDTDHFPRDRQGLKITIYSD